MHNFKFKTQLTNTDASELYSMFPDLYDQDYVLLEPLFVKEILESDRIPYFYARRTFNMYLCDGTVVIDNIDSCDLKYTGDSWDNGYYFVRPSVFTQICQKIDEEAGTEFDAIREMLEDEEGQTCSYIAAARSPAEKILSKMLDDGLLEFEDVIEWASKLGYEVSTELSFTEIE